MEKENKNIRLRLMSGVLALSIAAGTAYALKPSNAYATGSKIVTSTPVTKYKDFAGHKIGTYVDETTGKEYYTIEVIENDNASKISEIAIGVYKKEKQIPKADLDAFEEENTKVSKSSFWPAVVYMNVESGRKFRIRPGDILIIPTEYEEFKSLNSQVKRSGWFANYCAKNGVYPKKIVVYIDPREAKSFVKEVVSEGYQDQCIEVSDEYVKAFYQAMSVGNVKIIFKDGAVLKGDDQYYALGGDYIPSQEDVEEIFEKNITKKKSK